MPEGLAVCRLGGSETIPTWATSGGFFCVVRGIDELSIVVSEELVPKDVLCELGWIALKLEGPFPFSMTGVLASFLQPLGDARISIFAISTFDTDYVLIKREQLERAQDALAAAGHLEIS